MSEIIIHREGLAERCEICHQEDCFDAFRNFCSRCQAVINPQVKPKKISSSVSEREQKTRLLIREISRDLAQKATPRTTTKKKKAVKPNFIGFCVATAKILQNPPKKKQRSRSLERYGNYGVVKKPRKLRLARSIGAIVFLLIVIGMTASIFYVIF